MAITRIQNNQITDSSAGNIYLGVNAAAKVQDYSITSGKIQNNLVYGSDLTITGNLTVQGNTTTVDTHNLVVEDPLILLAKEQTGSPTLDIGFIGKRGTSDNIAFVWDEGSGEFVTAFTTSENTNTTITINSYASLKSLDLTALGNLSVTGTSSFTGNITSNANVTGNVNAANFFTPGQVSATGTITGGNVATGGTASATGNITGGNILTGGIVSATGNITGNYFLGNGAFLTGIDTTLISNGNSNVSIPTANGNVSISVTGTSNVVVVNSAGGNVNGYWNVTGDVTGANLVTAGLVTATGNVTGGNVLTNGVVSAAGNISGNNISAAGFVSATGNIQSTSRVITPEVTTASGDLVLNSAGGALQWDGTGNIVMNSQWINNLSNPTQSQDAATKQYVDDAVSTGITIHTPVDLETPVALPSATYTQGGNTYTVTDTIAGNTVVFSTAANLQPNDQLWFTNSFSGIAGNTAYFVVSTPNTSAAVLSTTYSGVPVSNISNATGLTQSVRVNSGQGATLTATANAALVVDGVSVSTGNRILVYNQLNTYENGVYDVTQAGNISAPWILTRSSDSNTYAPNDINGLDAGDYFYVKYGSTGAGESYVMTAPVGPFVIGYNGVTFTQFSASQVYTANTAAGLVLNGTIFSAKVDNDTTAFDGGGNITVKAGANLVTPNIGAATGSSLSLTGNLVSANVNSGIVSATGNITGNYILGNGAFLSGIDAASIQNGTSNVRVVSSGGNVTVGIGGTGNIAVFSTGGLDVNGIVTVTGTVTGGNLATGGTASATGNVTGGNLLTGGYVSATGNVDGGNLMTGGIASVVGTVFGGNISTNGFMTAGGNVTGGNFDTAGNLSATGNVIGGNINTAGVVSATGNVTSGNVNTTNVSATGNVNAVGFTGGNVSVTGNVYAANFIGNISGNIDAAGSNTQVQFNDTNDQLGASANFTFDKSTNVMSVTGTIQGTTISATGNVIGGNVTTVGLISATGLVTGGNFETTGYASATGNVTGGNILTGGYVTATGNVTGANLILTSGTVDGPAAGIININGSGIDTDFAVNGDTLANVFYVDAGLGTASFGNSGAITNAIVSFNTTDSIKMPVGNTNQRPNPATIGMTRFNTAQDGLEVYTSTGWTSVGEPDFTVITADSFTGNGVQTQFTLSANSTTAATIVSINGVMQIPTTAYAVSGNVLTFTEAPGPSDTIDARLLTTTVTVTEIMNTSGNAAVAVTDAANDVLITGDLLPTANVTFNLGSPTAAWNNAYFNGTTIFLGNLQLKQVDASTFGVFQSDGTTAANVDVGSIDVSAITQGTSAIGIAGVNGNAYITVGGTANVLVASTNRVTVTGDMSVTGNVTAQDVNSLSDAVLKTNIQPISSIESVIYGLKGVEYDWKNGTGHSYGFLAQEVEQVLPSAVKTGPDGLKAVNYQMIIPFLVETIKQMGDEIQDLKRAVRNRRGKKN